MNRIILTLVATLTLVSCPLHAESITHTIASDVLKDSRTVTVSLPRSYTAQTTHDYPVLVLLDGENNLDFTRSTLAYLAELGAVPEWIVVGVHGGATRALDYLPIHPQTGSTEDAGAPAFLQFLTTELMPWVRDQYRAAPMSFLSGHSYGGVFVSYVVLNHPKQFDGYLAQSPYWGPGLGKQLVGQLVQRLQQQSLPFFHASLGAEPQLDPQFSQLEKAVAKNSSDMWHTMRLEDETHMGTRLPATYAAIKQAFADHWPLPTQQVATQGLDAITSHQDRLSKHFGFSVLLPASTWQVAIQTALSQGQVDQALAVAENFRKVYNQSGMAYFWLAQAQAASGDHTTALKSIEKANHWFSQNDNPAWTAVEPALRQLKSQLMAQMTP